MLSIPCPKIATRSYVTFYQLKGFRQFYLLRLGYSNRPNKKDNDLQSFDLGVIFDILLITSTVGRKLRLREAIAREK